MALETDTIHSRGFVKYRAKRLSDPSANMLGWATHYLIGLGFVYGGHCIKQKSNSAFWNNSLVLGVVGGLVGIASWKFLRKMYPGLPITNRMAFYRQLVVAHIIFAAVANATAEKYGQAVQADPKRKVN